MSGNASREVEIFATAAEIESEPARIAYLEKACEGDTTLMRRVERLLGMQGDAEGFFGRSKPGPESTSGIRESFLSGSSSNPQTPFPAVEDVGSWIQQYRLLQKLGEGSGGVVYLAEQTSPVRRRVALKILKPGTDTRAVVARFEAERQALAMMDHPNIARVIEAGATPQGRPFFVMELVRGIPILDYCDRNQVAIAERLSLFVQVCHAIQHAHQKGIIHRDIKPSNILVSSADGDSPVVKVIDFGIAKAINSVRLTDKTLFTQFEFLVGTPAYMSPEQADLTAGDVDTRSDIYSLGILLFELLTGRPPFESKMLLESGLDGLRRTIRDVRPPRPSLRLKEMSAEQLREVAQRRQTDPGRLQDLLKGELDWVVLKAIEKDRTRRYETANALAMDVQRHLGNQPVTARPPSRAYELKKLAQRNRTAVVGVLAVVVSLLAGVIVSAILAVRARRAEQAEVRLRERAERSSVEAETHRQRAIVQAYASDMKAADVALSAANRGQAVQLLRRYIPQPGSTDKDLRGIEWRHLWNKSRGLEKRTVQMERIVSCIAYSPDGKWLAVANVQHHVSIVDVATGATVAKLPGMNQIVSHTTVAWIANSDRIAVARDDGVTIYETKTWQSVQELKGNSFGMTVSPDGRWLAHAVEHEVRLFETGNWKLERTLDFGPQSPDLTRMTFSHDSRRLVGSKRNRSTVVVWEVATGRPVFELPMEGEPNGIAVSPDGHWLGIIMIGGRVTLWDFRNGKRMWSQTDAHYGWGFGIGFSMDSRRLMTGGGDQIVRIWSLEDAAPPISKSGVALRGHENEIWAMAVSPDGKHFATGSKDATVRFWDIESREETRLVIQPAPGGIIIETEGSTNTVRAMEPGGRLVDYNLATGLVERQVQLPADCLSDVGSRSTVKVLGGRIYSATTNGMVDIRAVADGAIVRRVKVEDNPIRLLSVSAGGRYVFGQVPALKQFRLWDLESVSVVEQFPDFAVGETWEGWDRAKRVAFSPDGRTLAYASTNFGIALWDTVERKRRAMLKGHTWNIFAVKFSPDGSLLASASWDGRIRRWNPRTGMEAGPPLVGHTGGVHNLAFTPDGRTLLSSSDDWTIRFWNVVTGTETLSVKSGTAIRSNCLFGDGAYLGWRQGGNEHLVVEHIPRLDVIDESIRNEK